MKPKPLYEVRHIRDFRDLLGQSADRFSARVLELWTPVQIERALGLMLQLFRDIRYSLDPRYELELVVSRLSWISDYVSTADMKAAIVQARSLLMKGVGSAGSAPGKADGSVRGAVPASPGGNGPFSEADRFDVSRETVRDNDGFSGSFSLEDSLSGGESLDTDGESPPEEEIIANPFAAFKNRLNAGVLGAGKSQAAVVTASAQGSTASASSKPVEQAVSTIPVARAMQSSDVEDSGGPQGVPSQPKIDEPAIPEPAQIDPVSFSALPESLVSFFQTTKNMVATGLSQATGWKEEGSTVHFSVDKPFMHNFLEQDHKAIAEAAAQFLGRPVGIEIHLEASRQGSLANENQGVPKHVEMIRHMFRGTLVGDV
jgi:DNA polymerase-3 subunit gamma/tau